MRLGLYGGTFDPIHNAHLAVAQAALARFALDRVLVIPNRLPPHKQSSTGASYEHRLRMVQLACAPYPALLASDIENRETKSYTIQTLRQLRTQYREPCEFFFIIGADAFAEVASWYQVEEVFRMTRFLVVSRPGFSYTIPPGAQVEALDGLSLSTSATALRQAFAAGEDNTSLAAHLPAPVLAYIQQHQLYRRAATA